MTARDGEIRAIELAMKAELEAQAFYRDAAAKAVDPRGKDLLQQLARFEGNHYAFLVRARESLGAGGDYPLYEGTDFQRAAFGPAIPVQDAARKDLAGILNLAIGAEERAEAGYRRLADTATSDAGRGFFARMADEEGLHRKVLNDQFYALTNRGLWTWGD